MDETKNKQLVLEELRKVLDKKFLASDALDGKLQNMLNFLSIVVTVVPTLQLLAGTQLDFSGVIFVLMLMVVLLLYFSAFRQVVSTVRPVAYRQPISKDWDELSARYFHGTEEDVLKLTISEYLISSQNADEQNDRKMIAVRNVGTLMFWIVILLLLAVPVNLL